MEQKISRIKQYKCLVNEIYIAFNNYIPVLLLLADICFGKNQLKVITRIL